MKAALLSARPFPVNTALIVHDHYGFVNSVTIYQGQELRIALPESVEGCEKLADFFEQIVEKLRSAEDYE